jgi:hypothetical protein
MPIVLSYRVPEECPQEVAELLLSCRLPEPANRPSAARIVSVLREHLGVARQPFLTLESPIHRFQRRSGTSSSMERTAEQMSMRGAEAVQLRAERLGTRHTFDLGDHTFGDGPVRVQ